MKAHHHLLTFTVPAFLWIIALVGATRLSAASRPVIDVIRFGDSTSENAHAFKGESTAIVKGGLEEAARISQRKRPDASRGGDLTFIMKVDPEARNYFTLKFWGSEKGGKAIVDIGGEQIGYRSNGDYEAINGNNGAALPGRFYYATIMLPLERTQGREQVELRIRTYLDKAEDISRGYYQGYLHTQPYLDVTQEKQGVKPSAKSADLLAPDSTEAEKQALLKNYRDGQIQDFRKFSAAIDKDPAAKLSIVRYQDELRYYSSSIDQPWSPADTPKEKRRALERVFQTIDNHVRDYYGNTKLVTRGGHQGDWGGYYGALGEALYIVEPLIKNESIYGSVAFQRFLDQPFQTNTRDGENSLAGVDWQGGELTRREAWERTLKANYDFARSRLSYIYNQMLYTYEGAWEAHEGLGVIGSKFFEGKARSHQILREALGISPFLGEEIIVGADGRDLDLYHSLFSHDQGADFRNDCLQIIAKGLAKSKLDSSGQIIRRRPYGSHYIGISAAGLTKENGYVGTYGETPNYLPEYFYRTLGRAEDKTLNDDILKLALRNLHARSYTRYTSLDDTGHRIMLMEQVLDERKPQYPGLPAYAVRVSANRILLYASLEKFMTENATRYQGPEWADTWKYATEAVGFAQQQLADHQYFLNAPSQKEREGMLSARKADYSLPETYDYITRSRAQAPRFRQVQAAVVHPLTDFGYYTTAEIEKLKVAPADYSRLAWVDLENMMVVMRDGDLTISGIFNFRNRGFTGSGRLHVAAGTYEHLTQIATHAKFQYQSYYLRMNDWNADYMTGTKGEDPDTPQALAGEICPITWQPGVGTVQRENYEVDHPYSAYPDYLESRYGRYLFVFNTTCREHANEQSFEVALPADHTSSTILDLVSGRTLSISGGKLTLPPRTAMVLKLDSTKAAAEKPDAVNFVAALPGNHQAGITWKPTAGATTYTISRADNEAGPYQTIATGIRGNYYVDHINTKIQPYFYKVAAVNTSGTGWESYRARLDLTLSASPSDKSSAWRDDHIGTATTGQASITGSTLRITGGNGTGLGQGDDYKLDNRNIQDSLHFISTPTPGSFTLRAKLDQIDGKLGGLMLREQLGANTRYLYFGADQHGQLILQNRSRDTRFAVSGKIVSPMSQELPGYTVKSHPYLKLIRNSLTHIITAYASRDGSQWTEVGSLFTPFPYAVHTGVTATQTAAFSDVKIESGPQ